MLNKGEFVVINNDIGLVAFTGEELEGDLADHTGVWFGHLENRRPVIYTIPTDHLVKGPKPEFRH